jgi:hypothetical protein
MNDASDKTHAVTGECPSREVLSDLALGKLPMDAIDVIGQHVESCPACQSALESLDNLEDSVIADLKGQTNPLPPDPQLQEQIREAEQISHVVWHEQSPQPPEEPLPERLGQYQIIERIGRGGMGTVYKAMHTRLKRPVAIKVLPAGRLRDPQAIARFQREMEAVGKLDHPNLVRAHDAGEAHGQHFLVMEFLDGTDLGKFVRGSGPLPVADACEIIRQASLGLQYAHEHGTFLKKVMAHVREPFPPIRSLRSDVPEAVATALDRMVAKEPDRRFQTAAEVADAMGALASGSALKGVVAEQGGHQVTVRPPHRLLRSRNSHPLLMVLLLLVPVLVFGGWYAGTRIAKPPTDVKSSTPSSEEPFIRRSEAEAEGKKIWADMQPEIRKMNEDFAKMRRSMAADNEETMATLRKATAAAEETAARRSPPAPGNYPATAEKTSDGIPARPDN